MNCKHCEQQIITTPDKKYGWQHSGSGWMQCHPTRTNNLHEIAEPEED